MTVHTRIRAMTVAITAFIMCCCLFTTATLLTQPGHHGVLVSSLTFWMSITMILRLDCPRGSRRSSKKKSSNREQQSSLRGFLNLTELSSVTYIWVPASVNTKVSMQLPPWLLVEHWSIRINDKLSVPEDLLVGPANLQLWRQCN